MATELSNAANSPKFVLTSHTAAAQVHWLSLKHRKTAVKASGGCQSTVSGPLLFCKRRSMIAPGWYRPIDIDRSPCMIEAGHFTRE
jgi:hypothetical protein